MNPRDSHAKSTHELISVKLVFTTLLTFAALATALIFIGRFDSTYKWLMIMPLIVVQGLWLDRMYIVAHEAVHKKLLPQKPVLNDLLGTLLLMPIAAPLTIYRKIHYFHHSHNRRDEATAALDTFLIEGTLTPGRRRAYHVLWLFYVFMGGFFLHSLISILLFLAAPMRQARKLSVVFTNWRPRQRVRAWIEFLLGIGFHAAVWRVLGFEAWAISLGLPLAVFACVWSLLLYIYHYDTSVCDDVRHNVRSLPAHPVFSWLLLNFNEHATHHYNPSIPWYKLPNNRHLLPADFASNENVQSIWQAIWQQRKGPTIVEASSVAQVKTSRNLRRSAHEQTRTA